jgi:aspartyl-tRNA(Asn)/glutamyl-tRNA(Gln) amidotransferase subunit A
VVEELEEAGCEPGVRAVFLEAVATLERLGARVERVSLPHVAYGLPAYYLVAPAEASSNLARFDGVRYGARVDADGAEAMNAATRAAGFGPEVRRRIMIGTHALSSGYVDAYYLQAARVRTLIARDYARAFERVDVLISPTAPSVPFRLGERTDDPLEMYRNDVATVPASLAGIPALSVPVGTAQAEGGSGPLPVGLQVMAALRDDATAYRVARAVERAVAFDPDPAAHGAGARA